MGPCTQLTSKLYAAKWSVFLGWCAKRRAEPGSCSAAVSFRRCTRKVVLGAASGLASSRSRVVWLGTIPVSADLARFSPPMGGFAPHWGVAATSGWPGSLALPRRNRDGGSELPPLVIAALQLIGHLGDGPLKQPRLGERSVTDRPLILIQHRGEAQPEMPLLHNRQRHLPSAQEAVTKVRLEIIPAWRPSLATSSTSVGPRAVRDGGGQQRHY